MHELPWITILDPSLVKIIDWQVSSRLKQFVVKNVLFYFLHATLCPEHTIPLKQIIDRSFRNIRKDRLSDLALWRHHSWSVTSRERGVLALWRNIRRLFLHVPIGAKAIFTSE